MPSLPARLSKPPYRLRFLVEQARARKWTTGVELGVFRGRLFFSLLDNCPQLTMIGVDTWAPGGSDTPPALKKTAADTGARSYQQFPLGLFYVQVREKAERYGDRAMILRMTTQQATDHVPDKSVDFVFIDACHEEHAVAEDIYAWKKKIKPGGMLCGHDIDIPAVHRAVSRSVPKFRTLPDAVWTVQL